MVKTFFFHKSGVSLATPQHVARVQSRIPSGRMTTLVCMATSRHTGVLTTFAPKSNTD